MASNDIKAPVSARRSRQRWLAAGVLIAAFALLGSLAALALANTPTVASSNNGKLHERVLVSAQGRTLYVLSPETSTHLLCKSSACLGLWPPLTVGSASARLTAGPGVHGRLAVIERSAREWQVTLGGMPLYRYAGDAAAGQANGQDIHSFGGVWHVLAASGTSAEQPAGW